MSEYGRRWEQIREIRMEIQRSFPSVRTNRLVEAKEDAKKLSPPSKALDRLLSTWTWLEKP